MIRNYIYDTKERILYDKDIDYRLPVKLSKKEGKLLCLLSCNGIVSLEEISDYIYNGENNRNRIHNLFKRLRKKSNKRIKIINKYNCGYIVEDNIWLE